MKNKNLKLNICLGGIVCLIFALFLFHANFLKAAGEVILEDPDDPTVNKVNCDGAIVVVELSWTSILSGSPDYTVLRKAESEIDYTDILSGATIKDEFYTDKTADSDKNYYYKIKAQTGVDVYESNEVYILAKYCPPILQSTLIQTSCKPDGPYIHLEWTPVSGDLYSYEIYRRNSSEAVHSLLPAGILTDTFYEDGPDIIGTETYYYYIKSVWQDNASAHYDPEYGEPIPPCSPTLEGLSASCLTDTAPGGPAISLSWNKLLGIERYEIWRKTPDDIEFQLLDNGTIVDEEITNFEDKLVESYPNGYYNAGVISYKIKAVWATTFKDSNIQNIDIPKCPPFLSVTSDCQAFSMKLKWTATQSTVVYKIYRNGAVLPVQYTGVADTQHSDGLNLDICPGEQCSFDYYIRAFIGVTELIDSNTAIGSIDCATINPPEPAPVLNEPTNSCDLGDFKIYLSWSPSNNVIHYTLYRDSIAGLSEYITGDTAYTDSAVEISYDYTYSVVAFGENETSISDGTEYTVTAKDCSTPEVPALSLTPNCDEGSPLINLSWSDAGSAAISYVIYRGLLESALESIMVFNEGTEYFISRNWDDASVDSLTTYYYKVVAKGQDGTDSNGNPIQSESIVESAISYSCDPTIPNLTLANACNGNQAEISLLWTTDEANTTRYEIFRRDYSETTPRDTVDDETVKAWSEAVLSGTAYEYKVEAVGYSSSQRTTQGYKAITSYDCTAPGDFILSDPIAPYCQGSYPRVDLSWTDSADADSYDITRFNNTTAEEITLSDKTSVYTDFGYGNALRFDGNNDYVEADLPIVFDDIPNNDFTIIFWANVKDINGYSTWTRFMELRKNFSNFVQFNIPSDGEVQFTVADSGIQRAKKVDAPISVDTWYYFAGVWNAGLNQLQLYVDGILQSTEGNTGAGSGNQEKINIGRRTNGVGYFNGFIDEVRIYSRALSAVEVQEHYQGVYSDEIGLNSLWHFDEGEGQAASDSSNYGNNGRLGSTGGIDVYDPAWAINGLQSGENYNWQATAFNVGGEINSNLTAPITINCLPVKTGLVLDTTCDGIENPIVNLSWSYSYSADSFEIYREGAINPIATFTSVDPEFASRQWTDNTGLIGETSYAYWVKSINSVGGIESEQALITTLSCAEPSQPTNLTANFSCVGTGSSYPQIELLWDASTNTSYYTVYRNSSPVGYPTANSFTDSYSNGVEVNTNYQYYVTPFSLGGIVGPDSGTVFTIPDPTGYCTPSTLAITSLTTICESGASVNTIIWSDNTDFNTDHYDIYRNGVTETDKIASNIPAGTLKYIDNDLVLVSSTDYTYYIKAIGPTGLESPDFASESITTYSCGITPSTPALNLEADSPYCQGNIPYVDLNWLGVNNAYSYNLYRTNPDNSVSTSSTAVSPFTDKGDHALEFDGSNDYINCGNDASLQIIGDQTYEFWIKPDNFSRRRNPINKAYGGEGTITLEISGAFTYFWGTSGVNSSPYQGHSSGEAISAGAWTHVVHVRDIANGIMAWYFNGEPVGTPVTPSYAAAKASANNLLIGDGYVYPTDGQIDEVRIYGRALSSTEVQEHYNNIYNNETGLKGAWHFNEGSGSIINDDSGNSNNGSLINMSEDSWKYPDNKPHFINPLQSNQVYKYKIKAIGVDTKSEFSNEITITTGDCFIKPTLGIDNICTDRNNPITILNWDYYMDIMNYEVYKDSLLFEQKISANYISSNGYIKRWLLIGPYENNYDSDSGTWLGYYTDYIDEESVMPRKGETVNGQTWDDHFFSSDKIDFLNIFSPNTNSVAYAFTYIYSTIEQDAKLKLGKDDGAKVFFNGVNVFDQDNHEGVTCDEYSIDIHLIEGINTLLIKVDQGTGAWGFCARIVDALNNNILDHITTWDSFAIAEVSADYYVKAKIINEENDSIPVASNPSNCAPGINNLTITPSCVEGKTVIIFEWDEDPNTEYWSIYKRRQLDPAVGWVNIANISSPTSYTDENLESGVIYEYYLTAFGKEQQTNSDIKEARALVCDPYPSKPIIDVESLCLGDDPRMKIGWNDTTDTIAYNIWRKNITAGDLEYTKIEADLPFDTFLYYDKGEIYPLIPNDGYKYMVEAIGAGISNSNFSEESDEKIVIDCANIPPLVPILEIISTDAYGHFAYVRMGWIDSGNEKSYIVLRDGVEIAILTQGIDYDLEDSIIYYNDSTVSDATTYIYVIRAVNDIGSTDSNEATAIVPIARPGNFTLSVDWIGDTEDILLTWTEAASTTAGGIVSYRILRDDTTDFVDAEEICTGIEIAPFECADDSPTLLIRYYRVVATNLAFYNNPPPYNLETISNTVDIITVILPTWKEVKP